MFKFKFVKRKKTKEDSEFVEREVKKLPGILSKIFVVYVIIFVCIMAWYFSFRSTYTISHVYGPSMSPTLNKNLGDGESQKTSDMVYINTKKTAQRGDIVTINTEQRINVDGIEENKIIIKRVIATQGDKISIYIAEDGFYHVFIKYADAEEVVELDEDYIKSYASWTQKQSIEVGDVYYEKDFYDKFLINDMININDKLFYEVPQDCYFCLGDNRKVSLDSRIHGVFRKEKLEGVADIIVAEGSNLSGARLFFKKWGAIWGYYWTEIEKMFAR